MASETICVLPWVHAATLTDGTVQLCCVSAGGSGVDLNESGLDEYWNGDYVRNARRRMLAGKRVAACEHCYREEAHSRRSQRTIENDVWSQRLGDQAIADLIEGTGADGTVDAPIQYIDLRLGNTCNMQCVMCQPRESSRWLPLARRLSELSQDRHLTREWGKKAGIVQNRFEWYRHPEFWTSLTEFLPGLRQIHLAGGEPMLIKQQAEFVKACCEMGEAAHISLHYHTNATIFPEELVPYWDQFEQVFFMISIDGVGDVANYVRYPSDWDRIVTNIRRLDSLGENSLIQFHSTIHALNVYRLPELLEWADTADLKNRKRFDSIQGFVGTGLVHDPVHQDIRVLPPDFKQVITRRLTDYIQTRPADEPVDQLNSILHVLNSEDRSRHMRRLTHHTRLLDQIRGTDVLSTFPELTPYWRR